MNIKRLITTHNLFIVLLIFSILGVALSDISPVKSTNFWLVMLFLFGGIAIVNNIRDGEDDGDNIPLKTEIIQQVLHWAGGLVAVLIIYSFYYSERLTSEATGLVVLLILALTTYLDGLRLGWRFSFAGIFLAVMAVFAAFIVDYMWVILLLALGIIAVSFLWEFKLKNSSAKPEES